MPITYGSVCMSITKAIAAVRTITVKASSESDHAVGETRASRSTMDQIEASSKETLPACLGFKVIPFEGLDEQVIRLLVSVITGGSQPVLKCAGSVKKPSAKASLKSSRLCSTPRSVPPRSCSWAYSTLSNNRAVPPGPPTLA